MKIFCKAKGTAIRTKWQPQHWEKMFANPKSDRGLIFHIYNELKKLYSSSWDSFWSAPAPGHHGHKIRRRSEGLQRTLSASGELSNTPRILGSLVWVKDEDEAS